MIPTTLQINVFWDDEAKVGVATSEDILGLVTEAETLETLVAKLKFMVPELLEVNQFLMTHRSSENGSTISILGGGW